MTLEELLKAQNLTDEQVTAIIGGMKENKIFTASEENLDIRYGKLKTNHDALVAKDAESQKLIEELQKATKGPVLLSPSGVLQSISGFLHPLQPKHHDWSLIFHI